MSDEGLATENSTFWTELCGTQLAMRIGVTDDLPASLKKFDDWYFDFYPYLETYIPFAAMKGKDVLEIGLGYGTVAQRIAESGAVYTGLDIAPGPVAMVKHRLAQRDLPGDAVQGDILKPPFGPASFDYIVSIGCLHHTGDMRRSIEQCRRLLRPGGKLILMVYSAYSFRRWAKEPVTTLNYFYKELAGYRGVVGNGTEGQRVAYDKDSKGRGAPHTDWISVRSLREVCKEFSSFSFKLENFDELGSGFPISRKQLLNTFVPRVAGLDLYVSLDK